MFKKMNLCTKHELRGTEKSTSMKVSLMDTIISDG